jgi:DNA-directed RNA polymerase specialized sigma24 family protein
VVRFLPFFHRNNSTGGAEEELDGLADTPQVEPGENLEARTALRDELEQAMNKVGREKLTALLLHMDGFSYKEICDITGDSLSSVKSQIFRAKDNLRRVLNPGGLAPESQEGQF